MARASQQRTRKRPSNKSNEGYNADAEQAKRSAKVHTVVGQQFHRRVMDHGVSREADALQTQQRRINLRVEAKEREITPQQGMTDEEIEDIRLMPLEDREAIEDEIKELGDEAETATYDLLMLLLVDADGKAPTLDLLHKMDMPDFGRLLKQLLGGGEPAEGPTQTPSSSS
jgi:hypothetical protein